MLEKLIDIPTADGAMDTFVTHPDAGGPFPSVFIFMDIWGLREELYDIARRVAVVGYHCIVPNFWYRNGRVRFEHRNGKGEMLSMPELPPEVLAALKGNMAALTDAMAMRDVASILEFLKTEPVRPGPKGGIGYCLGGRLALCAAAQFPDDFRATASMHGTHLVSDAPDSPHLFRERFKGEIYCGFAETDSLAPPETIETLKNLLSGLSNVGYRVNVHPGTVHGYSLPDRPIFRKECFNRDWENIFPMLQRQLA